MAKAKKKQPKAAKKAAGKAKRPQAPVKPTPRPRALPGMEALKDATLERLAERISDRRETLNQMRADDKDDVRMALTQMQKRKFTIFRHAGVEFIVMEGEIKLKVQATKAGATATDDAPAPANDAQDAADADAEIFAEADE